VSLATGTQDPDSRVNYARGMVLGLGEFQQEQLYFLQKDYVHERALHGYGTGYGLHVSVTPAGSDFQVQVDPGMGIDQWGREFVLRCAQCAQLGAWLAAQEQQNPGTIAANLDPSGGLTVYVVASYDSCLDDLVPLPGQPCSSSAQTQVPSRIRDAADVTLTWQPPAMPGWDADRLLARLIDSVHIVPGLSPADSDEATIIDDLLALPAIAAAGPSGEWPPELGWPAPSNDPSGAAPLRLPAETAADALDRIFTVWVTQVRPQLLPALTSPDASSDPSILLAAITFVPASPFVPAAPQLLSCDDPDDADRPYLLHTRLIQELQRLGAAAAKPPAPPQQLVTLEAVVDVNGVLQASAVFHKPVRLTTPVGVASSTGDAGAFGPVASQPDATGFATVWTLDPPAGFPVPADGAVLAATFGATSVLVGDSATTLADLERSGTTFLDTTPVGDVVGYATVRTTPPPPPPPPRQVASVEWVTITPNVVGSVKLPIVLELWFHPQPAGPPDNAIVEQLAVQVFDERTGTRLAVVAPVVGGGPNPGQDPGYGNVWRLTVRPPRQFTGYLRLVFDAAKTGLKSPIGGVSLRDWITEEQIEFIGWDPARDRVIAFARVPGTLG
jgi:hypothetical protein